MQFKGFARFRGGERLQNLVARKEWGRSPAVGLQGPSKAIAHPFHREFLLLGGSRDLERV